MLGELHLESSLARSGPGCKHIKDESGPVEDFASSQLVFQVSLLSGRQLIVTDDCVDLELAACVVELLELSLAEIRVRRPVYPLGNSLYDRCARGASQFGQFVERVLRIK